jgi:hypothetical protein
MDISLNEILNESLNDWDKFFKSWLIIPIYLILTIFGGLLYLPIGPVYKVIISTSFIVILLVLLMLKGLKKSYENRTSLNIGLFFLFLFYPFIFAFTYSKTNLSFQLFLFNSLICFFSTLAFSQLYLSLFNQQKILSKRKNDKDMKEKINITISDLFVFIFLVLIRKIPIKKNDNHKSSDYEYLMLIYLIINNIYIFYSGLFIKHLEEFLKNFSLNKGNYIYITQALVLIGATLSLLAFTYILTLKDDDEITEMKKNGKYFFNSTSSRKFIKIIIKK